MTTPTNKAIIQKAKELWHMQEARNGNPAFDIEPELRELREQGLLAVARSELMRDNARHTAEEWKTCSEQTESLDGFNFNGAEAKRTTTFISGSRGTGKSDLAMMIAEQLQSEGLTVAVFDSSTDWLKRSSIGRYITVQSYSRLEVPKQSTIFDISLLTPLQQQTTVENFNKALFEAQLNSKAQFYLIFEEAQLYFPLNSIRAKRFQNSARILTVGRNVNVSLCAISQFPSSIDKEIVKNSQQIYIGCTAEPNTLAYWRGILGNKTAELKKLQNGEFLYYNRNKIEKIEIQPFEGTTAKTAILTPQPKTLEPQSIVATTDYTPLLRFVVVTSIGLAILLLGML